MSITTLPQAQTGDLPHDMGGERGPQPRKTGKGGGAGLAELQQTGLWTDGGGDAWYALQGQGYESDSDSQYNAGQHRRARDKPRGRGRTVVADIIMEPVRKLMSVRMRRMHLSQGEGMNLVSGWVMGFGGKGGGMQ